MTNLRFDLFYPGLRYLSELTGSSEL